MEFEDEKKMLEIWLSSALSPETENFPEVLAEFVRRAKEQGIDKALWIKYADEVICQYADFIRNGD